MEKSKKLSGLSTAGMVLGIISISLFWIPILNYIAFLMGFLAFIFGLIGTIKSQNRGKAIAGLVLGLISICLIICINWTFNKTLQTVNNQIDDINGTNSSYNKKNNDSIPIGRDDVMTGKDVEITISDIQFSQKVEPPVKNMYYTYYQVDDSDNTYLYLVLNCKNISTIDLGAESVARVTAKYKNDYKYSSFSAIPDNTLGFTYTSLTSIKPLTSQSIYFLIEMPKSIAEETDTPIEVNIEIDNKTYVYKYR